MADSCARWVNITSAGQDLIAEIVFYIRVVFYTYKVIFALSLTQEIAILKKSMPLMLLLNNW